MVNAEGLQGGLNEDTWVLPIFIKPGKNDFLIRTPKDTAVASRMERGDHVALLDYQTREDAAFKFEYHRKVIAIREESVPNFTK